MTEIYKLYKLQKGHPTKVILQWIKNILTEIDKWQHLALLQFGVQVAVYDSIPKGLKVDSY